MAELLAIAFAMEKEAAQRYAELAQRMRDKGQARLAEVFERLVKEETGHIENVTRWSRQSSSNDPDLRQLRWTPKGVFDDENTAVVSPELVDPYHSFAMAVRNEERAFAFWSYVASSAPSTEIRSAAEQMAREELEHARVLRIERRRAFSSRREANATFASAGDLAMMEEQVAIRLKAFAAFRGEHDKTALSDLAAEARDLAQQLTASPLGTNTSISDRSPESLDALCELLAESYLNAGEKLPLQADRDRAQILATTAIKRLATLRYLDEQPI
ncbi:ferritin family protein [Mesorhizobium sp. B2-6-4]|uniref:ferritin-like domain-containing protein n=1 Tax=Mesorhizobium sp. B2-6-4 TaxID=2589913 RepID=UPI0015E313D3|nr:ferritin family protein [Mesorhizobium sp. B2-6-4]